MCLVLSIVCMYHVLCPSCCIGNWNNWFTATLKLTNTDNSPIAVTDVFGEYRSHGTNIMVFVTSLALTYTCR